MLFIHPMWDHESQRIGKRKCTPAGYALHVIGEMIGFFGLQFRFVVPGVVVRKWWAGTLEPSLCWIFALAYGLGVVSEILVQSSWSLALMKSFKYDYERCEASWMEAGECRTYKYPGLTNG